MRSVVCCKICEDFISLHWIDLIINLDRLVRIYMIALVRIYIGLGKINLTVTEDSDSEILQRDEIQS